MNLLSQLGVDQVLLVPIAEIDPNPAQPRRRFDPRGIRELADSIQQNGLLCPISLRRVGERYQLIAGERRLMAFQLLGEQQVPALLEQADDRRSAVLALVENLQRRDLTFLEEASAISALIEAEGLTQRETAARLGVAQSTVANKLRLLRLPRTLIERLVEVGCTERHARALLPLAEDPARLERAVSRILSRRLNVAQSEALVEQLLAERPKKGARLLIIRDLRLFTSTINRAVEVMKQAGINAEARKIEDEATITYTIVIPKIPTRLPALVREKNAAAV
ncbi:MAG: ParB/RepB/Spo0J family partition protein [Oscillospiraceae bacterium]